MALVGPAAGGYAAVRHLVVDLAVNPFQTLTQAVTDMRQALADEGATWWQPGCARRIRFRRKRLARR